MSLFKGLHLICIDLFLCERAQWGVGRKHRSAKGGSRLNGCKKLVRCWLCMGHINSSSPSATTSPPLDATTPTFLSPVMWGKQMHLTKDSSFHPDDVCWKHNDCLLAHARWCVRASNPTCLNLVCSFENLLCTAANSAGSFPYRLKNISSYWLHCKERQEKSNIGTFMSSPFSGCVCTHKCFIC